MQELKRIPVLLLALVLSSCQQSANSKKQPATMPNSSENTVGKSPDELFGQLFHDVQMAEIFPDSKTFADCTPKFPPSVILKNYSAEKSSKGFDLKKFTLENFEPPAARDNQFVSDLSRSPEEHIAALWEVLTRKADSASAGSLLPLPHPFVVPGGRFREIYYWDSYFTMLGLQVAGRRDLIENMVANFAYLLDTYGHIPNGNRAYYLSRSQPPFFSLMVRLLDDMSDKKSPDAPLLRYLAQLEKEHQFWMTGGNELTEDFTATRRVVRLAEGQLMNRYWDDHPAPRPESYREDVRTAESNPARPKAEIYRNIKAAAESGWDFSSRWNVPGKSLRDINTVDVVPVDLNCLMVHLEQTLAEAWSRRGDAAKAQRFGQLAYKRSKAIRQYFFNKQAGWFDDFNWVDKSETGILSLAGMFPLWLNIADEPQALAAAKTLETKFLRAGGLVATPTRTGQQWDAPNGWAPLQWAAIEGLRNFKQNRLADEIKTRWVRLCTDVYRRSGKMLEKYNVEDTSLESGGGEYPTQDGFGWTNGVLLKLLKE